MIQKMKLGLNKDYFPVSVKPKDRFKGTLVIGATGGGKTEFLANVVQNDSFSKVAKIIVDPSCWYARQCYAILKGKAHYCSLEHPIGLNPMLSPYKPFQVADIITEAVN
jgi:hypothetical protein